MTVFDIEVVSDTVCPWCYVGKRKLDAAIESWKEKYPDREDEFNITWKPFYLNPAAPKIGINKKSYYNQKFGPDHTEVIFARLAQVGASAGITFKFGGKTGNTRDSHRLIQLGRSISPAAQTAIVTELFKTYFEDEGDITDRKVLKEAGVRAGLDADEVESWLESGMGGDEVDREVMEAREENITSVPNFKVQGRYQIGGAQDSAVFVGLFERIRTAEAAEF